MLWLFLDHLNRYDLVVEYSFCTVLFPAPININLHTNESLIKGPGGEGESEKLKLESTMEGTSSTAGIQPLKT